MSCRIRTEIDTVQFEIYTLILELVIMSHSALFMLMHTVFRAVIEVKIS